MHIRRPEPAPCRGDDLVAGKRGFCFETRAILRDASLREAPQDEEASEKGALHLSLGGKRSSPLPWGRVCTLHTNPKGEASERMARAGEGISTVAVAVTQGCRQRRRRKARPIKMR